MRGKGGGVLVTMLVGWVQLMDGWEGWWVKRSTVRGGASCMIAGVLIAASSAIWRPLARNAALFQSADFECRSRVRRVYLPLMSSLPAICSM